MVGLAPGAGVEPPNPCADASPWLNRVRVKAMLVENRNDFIGDPPS